MINETNPIPAPVEPVVGLHLSDSEIWELNAALWRKHGLGSFARVIVKEINLVLAKRPNPKDHRPANAGPDLQPGHDGGSGASSCSTAALGVKP